MPSKYIIDRYKCFIDAGAQAVIAHHPHVIQGIISHKNKPIFFSLGNFLHSYHKKDLGLLVILDIDENKKIKSSYNTYLHIGLPPGPIANPGIDAISAAYNPQKTNCMYYLHDKNHVIHCAVSYAEQEANIAEYLSN